MGTGLLIGNAVNPLPPKQQQPLFKARMLQQQGCFLSADNHHKNERKEKKERKKIPIAKRRCCSSADKQKKKGAPHINISAFQHFTIVSWFHIKGCWRDLPGASIHFSDGGGGGGGGGGGKSKEIFKIFGALRAQSRNVKLCAQQKLKIVYV